MSFKKQPSNFFIKKIFSFFDNFLIIFLFLFIIVFSFISFKFFSHHVNKKTEIIEETQKKKDLEKKPISQDLSNSIFEIKPIQPVQSITQYIEEPKSSDLDEFLKETQLFTSPYIIYQDKENNTIREYRFFKNMVPIKKDINNRKVFFDLIDLTNNFNKIGLKNYYIRWTNGIEHLGEYETNDQGKWKGKHGWVCSKSNYQLILTNKPDETTKKLTEDFSGEDGFYNLSICYLNSCINFSVMDILSSGINKYDQSLSNYPYIRLITKNLELRFDWLEFIRTHFPDISINQDEIRFFDYKHQDNLNIFHSNAKSKKNYQFDRKYLIDLLKKIDLKDNQKLIKLRAWAIYNIQNEYELEEETEILNLKEESSM